MAVTVCITGYSSHGAIELTWALILAMLRHIPAEFASVQRGEWQISIGGDLDGKTMGLVGLGNIGAKIAKIAQAFGMNVFAWSQNLTREAARETWSASGQQRRIIQRRRHCVCSSGPEPAHERYRRRNGDWLNEADSLSRQYFARAAGRRERLGRGVEDVRSIAGAALDVYDIEPLPVSHPFRSLDRLLVTPHIGFVTEETYKIFYRDTVKTSAAWLAAHHRRNNGPQNGSGKLGW